MAADLPISEELVVHELKSIAYIANKWQQIIEGGKLPSENPNVDPRAPVSDLPPNMEQVLILLRNEMMLVGSKASALSEIIHENVG